MAGTNVAATLFVVVVVIAVLLLFSSGEEEVVESKESYVYDHRGLKVRKNSIGKGSSERGAKEEAVKKREESPSECNGHHVKVLHVRERVRGRAVPCWLGGQTAKFLNATIAGVLI